MPTVIRRSSTPYVWEVGQVPLSQVANVEKFMPREYITDDGLGITAACREYLYPLIQGEDYPPFENGLPQYVTLSNPPVAKRLPPFELRK